MDKQRRQVVCLSVEGFFGRMGKETTKAPPGDRGTPGGAKGDEKGLIEFGTIPKGGRAFRWL